MRLIRDFYPLLFLVLLYSCEVYQEEEELVCLPVNMTATIVQGTEARKIIADFNYVPGTELLDHITWSNHQTHYFEYNDANQLTVVRQMKVKEKVQEEMWFVYEGELAVRVILVKKNLDHIYLEPVDSIQTGYITFEFEGKNVIQESRYEVGEEDSPVPVRTAGYEYDAYGNIISSTTQVPGEAGDVETVHMTYDSSKHPFSGLRYYFSGESFVNNLLSKTSGIGDLDYQYEFRFNQHGYPETIFETLGSTHSRIIRYSYLSL